MNKICFFCKVELKAIETKEDISFSIPYYQMYECPDCHRIFQALDEPLQVKSK